MLSSSIYSTVALLAATAGAQSTRTATLLEPNFCVTALSQPTVTALGQGDVTTYSYSCSIDSAAVSSASARASRDSESARSKASEARSRVNDPKITGSPGDHNNKNNRRSLNSFHDLGKRDNDCFGWNAFEACIPWEITQGPSTWAVHYTASGIGALDQECSFGSGGVASGPATCTASGRLDPGVWGVGNGPRTHTFAKSDVDKFWIRHTVVVTAGGASATTGTVSGSRAPAASGSSDSQNTAVGAQVPIPMGLVAMAFGAGGILAAALAL